MFGLLFATLIRFSWTASPPPVPVDSYKVCIGTTPGACTVTASVNAPGTVVDVDLDVSKVWYAVVTGVNAFGVSDGSNQVVVGKPLAPTNFSGALSVT